MYVFKQFFFCTVRTSDHYRRLLSLLVSRSFVGFWAGNVVPDGKYPQCFRLQTSRSRSVFISVEILGATYVWVRVRFHATRHIVRKRNKFIRSNVPAGFSPNESRDGYLPIPSNSNDDNVSFFSPIHTCDRRIVYTCMLGVVFKVSRMSHRSTNLKAYGVRCRQYFFTAPFKFYKNPRFPYELKIKPNDLFQSHRTRMSNKM